MKRLICELIAQSPACYISTDNPAWRQASILADEARTTDRLLSILMLQYNSVVEPQASMYARISRIHEKSLARSRRRSIAESVALYRMMGRTPDQVPTDHAFHAEIVAALQGQEEVMV